MRIRTLLSVLVTLFLVAGCSAGDDEPVGSSGNGSDGVTGGPEASGGTGGAGSSDEPTSGGAGLGEFEGLCSWATPEQLEQIFGTSMDAVSLEGDTSCRVVAEGNTTTEGIYHVELDQSRRYPDLKRTLVANNEREGNRTCDQAESRFEGMRVLRYAFCQPSWGGQAQTGGPYVAVELAPGQLLTTMPFAVDSDEAAIAAAQKFEELLKALAVGLQGQPLINEFLAGKWVELHNPGGRPIDLGGYRLEGAGEPVEVPDGSTIRPKGHLVVPLAGLRTDEETDLVLREPAGRPVDVVDAYLAASQLRGPVVRRNGDGGPFCDSGSRRATKGKANPPAQQFCEG